MTNLSKKLETRHVNMIALGGSIGTGVFLASGYSVSIAGPGGAILGYTVMAIIVYFLMTSLGEMSVHTPSSGSFCDYSTKYVGPSFGFAMGYNYWLSWAITVAAEISAASLIMAYWFPHLNQLVFSMILFFGILFINFLSVRWYGESEYWLSFMKVALIITFIVVGSLALFHEPALGAHNLFISDGTFHKKWLGFISVFLFAGYAFQGTELIGVASGETKDPEVTIPKSVKMVFWRLTFFYVLSIAIISLLIPFTSKSLTYQDNVSMSPYTLIFGKYLSHYAGDIINFIILIALISAANASLYSSSRVLWYLGNQSHKTKWLTSVSNRSVPTKALLVTALVGSIVFLSSFIGNGKFFTCVVNIASISCFVAWFGIALSHYKFRKNYLPLNGGENILKFKAKFYPWAQIISMISLVFIIVAQFLIFDDSYSFIDKASVYMGILPFLLLYIFHKTYSSIQGVK